MIAHIFFLSFSFFLSLFLSIMYKFLLYRVYDIYKSARQSLKKNSDTDLGSFFHLALRIPSSRYKYETLGLVTEADLVFGKRDLSTSLNQSRPSSAIG